jgi:thiamine-phosphate pyrophosphorylase
VRLPDPPLLIITDRRQAALPLAEVAEAAFAAGCRWLSVQEKDLTAGEQIELAAQLRPLADRFGARLTLHGSPAYAAPSMVLDGIHLPDGADDGLARHWRNGGKLVGRSVHSVDQAKAGDARSLNYLVAGPVFATASKPGYGPALGVEGFAAFVRAATLPVIAIGGIDSGNAGRLMAAGAAGVALMGGVMRSLDPGREVRELLGALQGLRR